MEKNIIESLKKFSFEDLLELLKVNNYPGTRKAIIGIIKEKYPQEFKNLKEVMQNEKNSFGKRI